MAKTRRLCPFSGQMCRECPIYRGRHHFLCYSTRYRGHLGEETERAEPKSWIREPNPRFDIPSISPPSPTWVVLSDIVERKDK